MKEYCVGCGDELSAGNRSKAHILPNALGGRLAPDNIICKTCNNILDRAADNALVKAMGAIPTLLDIERERGDNPSAIIKTESGQRVRLEPSGALTLDEVSYEEIDTGAEREILIRAPSKKIAKQLLNKAKKKYPDINVDELMGTASIASLPNDTRVVLNVNFSPPAILGGITCACWLFLQLKEGNIKEDIDSILAKIKSTQERVGTWRIINEELPGLVGPKSDILNMIILRSIPDTGEIIAYVELLGVLKIAGVFAGSKTGSVHLFEHIYAHDPLNKIELSEKYSIDADVFEKVDWRKVGVGFGAEDAPEAARSIKESLEKVDRAYQKKAGVFAF